MDYRSNSNHTVATRLFWSEPESKIPANRQLDSHADRYRCDTHHIAIAWSYHFLAIGAHLSVRPLRKKM
jgi:hypothetical protein